MLEVVRGNQALKADQATSAWRLEETLYERINKEAKDSEYSLA